MSQTPALQAARPTLAVLVHDGFPRDCLIDVHELCKSFAGFIGEPVALATTETVQLYETLGALPGNAEAWKVEFVAPLTMSATAMSSADFLYKDDGRPDWSAMWTGFCELALYGGPPHRGEEDALVPVLDAVAATPDFDAITEIRRGIYETTGLFAERYTPGWIAVTCNSRKMAAWLAATIILENVEAQFDEERLLVPAHESFTLKNEVKSVITVVAKTHHYWQAHIAGQE